MIIFGICLPRYEPSDRFVLSIACSTREPLPRTGVPQQPAPGTRSAGKPLSLQMSTPCT